MVNNNNKIEDITKKRHEEFKNKVNEKTLDEREDIELLSSLVSIGDDIREGIKHHTQTISFELKDRLKSLSNIITNSLKPLPTTFINPIQNRESGVSNKIYSLIEDVNKSIGLNDINNIDGLANIKSLLERKDDKEKKVIKPINYLPEDDKKEKKDRETLVNRLIDSFGKSQYNIMRIMRDQMFDFTKEQATKNRVLLAGLKGIVYNPVTKTIIARLGDINRSVKESGKTFFGGLDRLMGGRLSSIINLLSGFMGKIGSGFVKLNSSLGNIGGKLVKGGAVAGVALSAMSGYNKIQAIKNDNTLTEDERIEKVKEAKFETGGQLAGGAIGGILGSFLGPIGTVIGSMLGDFIGGWVGKFLSSLDFSNLWDTIKKGVVKVWDYVSNIITDVVSGIWETIETFSKNIMPNIGKFFSDIAEDIKTFIIPKLDNLDEIISSMWDGFTEWVGNFADTLLNVIDNAFDMLVDGITWVIDKIPALISTTVSIIVKSIPKIVSFVGMALFKVGKFILKTAMKLPSILIKVVSGVGKGVFKLTKTMGSMFINLIKKMPSIIWSFVKVIPSIIWEGVTMVWDLLVGKFKDMMNGLIIWLDDAIPWDWLRTDKWKKMAENARIEMAESERKLQEENKKLIAEKEKTLENEKKLLGLEEESQELRFTSDMLTNKLSPEENSKIEAKTKPKQNEIEFLNMVSGIGIGGKIKIQGESSRRTSVLNNEYHTSKEIETTNNITPVILNNNNSVVNNETRTHTIRIVNTQNMDYTSNRYNMARVI